MNSLKAMAENAILNLTPSSSSLSQQQQQQQQHQSSSSLQQQLNHHHLQQQLLNQSFANDRNLSINMPQSSSSSVTPSSTSSTSSTVPSLLAQNTNQQSQQLTSLSPSLLQHQQQQQNSLNNTTNQETFIQPILGVAPLGKTTLTKDQNQQLMLLDSAFKKLPHASDTERIRNYLPRIMVNTPSYYPISLPNSHDSLDFLGKLGSETLFFMFYYMEVSL